MKSVGGHGSLSLLFVMKGGDGPLLCGQPSQGCYDHTHCYYLLIVVVISLQFHICVLVSGEYGYMKCLHCKLRGCDSIFEYPRGDPVIDNFSLYSILEVV
jgi:hypothetical protein